MAEVKSSWDEAIPLVEEEAPVQAPVVVAPAEVPVVAPVEQTGTWDDAVPLGESPMMTGEDRPVPIDQKQMDQSLVSGVQNNLIMAAEAEQPDGVIGPEIYDAVDADPKYQKLTDFENGFSMLYSSERLDQVPDNLFKEFNTTREELKQMYEEREDRKGKLFSKLGVAEKDPSLLDKIVTWGDYPVRKQYKMEDNIDFDPAKPEDDVNRRHKMNEYYVPPPDQNFFLGMGYQVARNLAGLVDFAKDAVVEQKMNISETGSVRGSMPQLPQHDVERFVADLTSYALGPELTLTAGARLAQGVKATKVGGYAARTVEYLSPVSLAGAKNLYKATLAKGGTHREAVEATQKFMKKVVVGAAIGMSEAVIADDDSSGIIPPEVFQKTFGVDARTAHDMSLVADSPVTSGVINTLGGIFRAGSNIAEKTVGGVKTLPLKGKIQMSSKEAGFRLLNEIDPQVFKDGPDVAMARVKMLNDLLLEEGTEKLSLGDKSVTVSHDTTTSTMRAAQKYFRQAYSERAEYMGEKEFNDWVSEQAVETSNRLLSLKTGLSQEAKLEGKIAKTVNKVSSLYDDAADMAAGGNLPVVREKMSDTLSRDRTNLTQPRMQEINALESDANLAKENYESGFHAVPEMSSKISKAKEDFELGMRQKIDDKFNNEVLGDKAYQSFKKLYNEKNDAFNKITANKNVQFDTEALLEKLKETGYKLDDRSDLAEDALDQVPMGDMESRLKAETENFLKKKKGEESVNPDALPEPAEFKASNPLFKEIGEMIVADPSAGNIAVNVHNKIKTEIKRLEKTKVGRDNDMIARLKDMDNFIKEKVPPQIQGDIDDAYQKFITYKTAWEDLDQMKELAQMGKNRANAENNNLPAGVLPEGQGVSNWKETSRRLWEQEKLNPSGEFVQSLLRASKVGGQDIKDEVADVLESNIFKDFGNKTLTGDQDMKGFRGILRNHIDTLNKIAPERTKKYVEMEKQLIDIEKNYVDKTARFKEESKIFNQFKTDMDNTVAAKFTSEVKGNLGEATGKYEGVSDPQGVMDSIFRAKDGGNQIQELFRKADELGGKKSDHVKDAIRGSYWDYLKRQTFGNTQGALAVGEDGVMKASKDPRSKGLLLSEDPKVKANITLLFGAKQFEDFAKVEKALDDATKTFNRGKMTDLRVTAEQSALSGGTSIVTFMFGVLNPKATMAKRIISPWTSMSDEALGEAKKAALTAAMADLPTAMKYMKMRPEELQKAMQSDEFKRFAARAYLNTTFKEKDRDFKVPPGVK